MIAGFAVVFLWLGGALVLGFLPEAFAEALTSSERYSRSGAPALVQFGWLMAALGYGIFHGYLQEDRTDD